MSKFHWKRTGVRRRRAKKREEGKGSLEMQSGRCRAELVVVKMDGGQGVGCRNPTIYAALTFLAHQKRKKIKVKL
jgi:hypothetical protein